MALETACSGATIVTQCNVKTDNTNGHKCVNKLTVPTMSLKNQQSVMWLSIFSITTF